MTIEHLKEGSVTYSQSNDLVVLAEKFIQEYFVLFGPNRISMLEDNLCGSPGIIESMDNPQGRFRATPFYPALARLVDKGIVRWWEDEENDIWYGLEPRQDC